MAEITVNDDQDPPEETHDAGIDGLPGGRALYVDCNLLTVGYATNGPQGGDGGHGSRTLIEFIDGLADDPRPGGTCWDLYFTDYEGREFVVPGPQRIRIEVQGDAEGTTLIKGIRRAGTELKRRWGRLR